MMRRAFGGVVVVSAALAIGCGSAADDGALDDSTGTSSEEFTLPALTTSTSSLVVSPTLSTSLIVRPPRYASCTVTTLSGDKLSLQGEHQTYLPQDRRFAGLDPAAGRLATVASLTLRCLETIHPKTFIVAQNRQGWSELALNPDIRGCSNGDEKLFRDLQNALLIQRYRGLAYKMECGEGRSFEVSSVGAGQRLATYFVATWQRWAGSFQFPADACPSFRRLGETNPPDNDKTPAAHLQQPAVVGKSDEVYRVDSPICRGDAACNVELAVACLGGMGAGVRARGDVANSAVYVDPLYWEYETVYTPASDPFDAPYWHRMSQYGVVPAGSLFGSLQRSGNECTRYVNGYHWRNHFLAQIPCDDMGTPSTSDDVYCSTECMSPAAAAALALPTTYTP
jgi:hypothetical protein